MAPDGERGGTDADRAALVRRHRMATCVLAVLAGLAAAVPGFAGRSDPPGGRYGQTTDRDVLRRAVVAATPPGRMPVTWPGSVCSRTIEA